MEGKNLPLFTMLLSGLIICITCIRLKFLFVPTLLIVLGTMIVFYFLGAMLKKIIKKINRDAEEKAELLRKAEIEEEERKAAERKLQQETAEAKEKLEKALQDETAEKNEAENNEA